eukprot:Gb_11044 [translate_table: standard]
MGGEGLIQSIRMSKNRSNSNQVSNVQEQMNANQQGNMNHRGKVRHRVRQSQKPRFEIPKLARKNDGKDILTKIQELEQYFKQNSMGEDEQISMSLRAPGQMTRGEVKKEIFGNPVIPQSSAIITTKKNQDSSILTLSKILCFIAHQASLEA